MVEKFGWSLKDIIVMCVLAVAFGALYIGAVSIWAVANAAFGPVGLDLVYGLWFVASVATAYIIRKPGIAFCAEMLAALAEVLLGTPAGVSVFLGAAIQGIGCEIVFAAFGWKKYSMPVLIFAGMGASITSFIYNLFCYGYTKFPISMLSLMLGLRLLSGALLCGVLGKLIGDGLAATGALSSFAIGRERAEKKVMM